MITRWWEFLEGLPDVDAYESAREYGQIISDELMEQYEGEITPNVRLSAKYFGYLCHMMKDGGNLIVTNELIRDAVHFTGINDYEEKILHSSELGSWLVRAGFHELETDYCISDRYKHFKRIFLAPIVQTFDDYKGALDQPVISVQQIRNELQQDFKNLHSNYKSVTESEVDAYVGLFRKWLHEGGWVRAKSPDVSNELWINVEYINERYSTSGEGISESRLSNEIIVLILENTTELESNAVVDIDDLLKRTKRKLSNSFEWNRLWDIEEGRYVWYPEYPRFVEVLTKVERSQRSKLESLEEFDCEVAKERIEFLERNKSQLKKSLHYSEEDISEEIMRLSSELEYYKEISVLEGAREQKNGISLKPSVEFSSNDESAKKREYWKINSDYNGR